ADRIDQTRWRLPEPRRRIAGPRLRGDRLRDERREGELVEQPVAERAPARDRVEGPGAVDHRVAQLDAAEVDQCPEPGTSAVSSWSPRTTGPSTQRRRYPPSARGTAQPKHAPKPQAIGVSIASSQATPCSAHIPGRRLEHRGGAAGVASGAAGVVPLQQARGQVRDEAAMAAVAVLAGEPDLRAVEQVEPAGVLPVPEPKQDPRGRPR